MSIYEALNELMEYIESHLEQEITDKKMASILGVNVHTMQSLFPLITGIGLKEYIRNRKLTKAVKDLQQGCTILEVSLKYGYTSAVAFSRAFTKTFGIKPKDVKKNLNTIRTFPILQFDANGLFDLSYRKEKRKAFTLYGVKKETNSYDIALDAPNFFKETEQKYLSIYGPIKYGMVLYENRGTTGKLEYWCMYKEEHEGLLKFSFPSVTWLIFKLNNRESQNVQNLSDKFYTTFLEKHTCKILDLPELEVYYEDGTMEFMVPIEN